MSDKGSQSCDSSSEQGDDSSNIILAGWSNQSPRRSMVRDDISNVILAPSDLDQLFRILSSHHRRFILLLVKHGAVETKTDIVEWGEKSDTDLDETSLVHSHLPKLDDAGYIDWNRTTGDISKGTDFDEIESFLDFLDRYLYKLPGN